MFTTDVSTCGRVNPRRHLRMLPGAEAAGTGLDRRFSYAGRLPPRRKEQTCNARSSLGSKLSSALRLSRLTLAQVVSPTTMQIYSAAAGRPPPPLPVGRGQPGMRGPCPGVAVARCAVTEQSR